MTQANHGVEGPASGIKPVPGINRRQFLSLASVVPLALSSAKGAAAGPFQASDFEKLVPPNKRLTPEWVASLTARGSRPTSSGADLDRIGMPIGGLWAGRLYLSGDGRLWLWDIFNHIYTPGTSGEDYVTPLPSVAPLEQGFALRITPQNGKAEVRSLDRKGFKDTRFHGEYPIGYVEYSDPGSAVSAELEAYSPFIPLNVEDSSLPATIMSFTVTNHAATSTHVEIAGWLQNAICLHTGPSSTAVRENQVHRTIRDTVLDCSLRPAPPQRPIATPEVFEEFEGDTYGAWKAEGTAFGMGPARGPGAADQRISGFSGKGFVNSYAASDVPTGKLISPEFTITRPWITFLIGGGNHPNETCINLVVDGKVVRTATGHDTDTMRGDNWNVHDLAGKQARFEIVDARSDAWGHIDIDEIQFADQPLFSGGPVQDRYDYGTMSLIMLDGNADRAVAGAPAGDFPANAFKRIESPTPMTDDMGSKLCGVLARTLYLAPGARETVTFAVTWHFPNLTLDGVIEIGGRHYGIRFKDSSAVARHVADNYDNLSEQTKLWHKTWHDSTLPWWFLQRTMANTTILATTTCYRLASGRFYAWEGIGCCAGTCTHVWHYAHAPSRLFPAMERDTRERVDFEISFDPHSGIIDHRGEFHAGIAIDGQAGTILRAYREHQMSPDDAFLRRTWTRIRRATECLIERDGNGDGILEGPQHNTLDAEWFGKISWLSSLYLASLRAAEEMAKVVQDHEFAKRTRAIFDIGKTKIMELYNGEYFIQKPDPAHLDAVGSFGGSEIDQVFGQSWAFQVGLGRILPEAETRSALRSLWKYNFTPDVGPYRKVHTAGRWYAMPGEAGLLMVTHPHGDDVQFRDHPSAWSAMYFNECMSGFEHQVAGHMLWEGLVTEGLAVERAIHDRYDASRRNPWNEVECSDHYSRAMASYGVYVAACGYEYNGPAGHLGFAPRISPDDFRAGFTAAEGWGTYSQKRAAGKMHASVAMRWGKLRLRSLAAALPAGSSISTAHVTLAGRRVNARLQRTGDRALILLDGEAGGGMIDGPPELDVTIPAGQVLEVTLS